MRGTVVRAILVSGLGIAFTLFGRTGALLLASMSIAYLLGDAELLAHGLGRGETALRSRAPR